MQYSCHLLCENTKYTNKKELKKKKKSVRSSAFGHMFSSTSHLISSLARHLGKNLLVCLILPGIVQLWCLGMHYILEGHLVLWTMVKNPPCQAQKTPQWGWGKGSKGQEKETSFSNGCQTMLWLHWEWWNATLLHVITYIGKWSPTCPLSLAPVFGTDLLKSHIYAGVHFSTQDQPKEVLFYCILSCDWKNLNTWVCFLDGNQL